MMVRQLRIRGLVQGVGYRAGFNARAHALRLSGWVRNRSDGSVEAMVAGGDAVLAQIIDWAWHGPSGARVHEVTVDEVADPVAMDEQFRILPTL
ncbi:MAG: acylphosphatase [Herminiimonas sp.]|nr:acylphosphatase [Herminiimonas sp.]